MHRQRNIDCPRCGVDTCFEQETANGEVMRNCSDCGYSYTRHIQYDEAGDVILKGGQVQWCVHEEKSPYASIMVMNKSGIGEGGFCRTRDEFEKFTENYGKVYDIDDVHYIKYSIFDGESFKKGTLYEAEENFIPRMPFMGKGGDA